MVPNDVRRPNRQFSPAVYNLGLDLTCQREGKDGGSSLYEPREGYQMMRVAARELEGALRERGERREPVSGVEFICVQGVQGLRGAGVLQGVRAMAARVYAGEDWYSKDCFIRTLDIRTQASHNHFAKNPLQPSPKCPENSR